MPARPRSRSACSPPAPVQFCYEIAGPNDFLLLFDCANMDEFNAVAEDLLASTATVRRYETLFVKREVKFAPFVELGGG